MTFCDIRRFIPYKSYLLIHDDQTRDGRATGKCTSRANSRSGPKRCQDLGPVITENLADNPIQSIDTRDLKSYIITLFEAEFENKDSVTFEELWIGAKLASSSSIPQPCWDRS